MTPLRMGTPSSLQSQGSHRAAPDPRPRLGLCPGTSAADAGPAPAPRAAEPQPGSCQSPACAASPFTPGSRPRRSPREARRREAEDTSVTGGSVRVVGLCKATAGEARAPRTGSKRSVLADVPIPRAESGRIHPLDPPARQQATHAAGTALQRPSPARSVLCSQGHLCSPCICPRIHGLRPFPGRGECLRGPAWGFF